MDGDPPRHRRVYAKGFFDGLAAAGKTMTPQRRDALLKGQTGIAQKVYTAVTTDRSGASTTLEVAQSLKANTGSTVDIHTLRGCLATLAAAGLVREVVPGSFRRADVKDKEIEEMAQPTTARNPSPAPAAKSAVSPIDILAGISDQLRALMAGAGKLADDIDAAALAIEERGLATAGELAKFEQLKSLLKGLD